MLRRSILLGAALALACGPSSSPAPKKSGAVVAEGKGFAITADDFKARLEEQSPFLRARYTTLERKKEFLDNMVSFELLAKAAEKEGLQNDPEVQNTLKKVMVQKLVSKKFGEKVDGSDVPEADLRAHYDAHKDDYFRAKRVRVAVVSFTAEEGSPERAAKLAAANKLRAELAKADKNPSAFGQAVADKSEDMVTKAAGGDLGYKTQAELETLYSKAFADGVFGLADGGLSEVLETPKAIYVAKVTGHQDEMNREFETVRAQLAQKVAREKRTKEFEAWKASLLADGAVKVHDAELEKIEIAQGPGKGGAGPKVTPGMPPPGGAGHGMTMPPPGDGHGAAAAPAPAPTSK